MADPISTLVLKIIKRHCPANSCPFRQGDEEHSKLVAPKLDIGLKHRVSDGNTVKDLEASLAALKAAAIKTLEAGRKRKLNAQDIAHLEKALGIQNK